MRCFNTESDIPNTLIDLKSGETSEPWDNHNHNTPTNEVTSIQMEFRALSWIFENPIYEQV